MGKVTGFIEIARKDPASLPVARRIHVYEEFTLPMGTAAYMSPEQVQFVRSDPRSDLFALGVMLYHLATGERHDPSQPQPGAVPQLP